MYKELRRGHKNEGEDPSIIIIFDNGYFTTISGDGHMFHSFCKDKTLGNYTGRNYVVCKPDDPLYRHARM